MHLLSTLGQALEAAADQHHLLAASDLTALGLDHKQVSRLCDERVIERVVRGLYRVSGTRSPLQDIAAATSRHGAGVASHVSALFLHGCEVDPPTVPHVTLPPGATSRTTISELHRSPLGRGDVTRRSGIPVTTLARSIVDSAAFLSEGQLHDIVAAAFAGRRTTLELVQRSAQGVEEAPGRLGSGRLRAVLAGWADPIRPDSVAEATVLRRIAGFGLPRPVTQHDVVDRDGSFVARVDLAWP
ncbi:MAG: type IV toxin-antitoxin system AbiEi family antitoxin domain-containing protein, partial [Acidimicrobiia bacterium]